MSLILHGTNGITFNDSSTQASGKQAVKAWVSFNGTGTVAIRESYNVTSITDHTTGDYTVNFTTALNDANYCFGGTVGQESGGGTVLGVVGKNEDAASITTSAIRIYTLRSSTGAIADYPYVNFWVFR